MRGWGREERKQSDVSACSRAKERKKDRNRSVVDDVAAEIINK